ncbi:MAG: hypothetical protein ACJ8AT_22725 [Hyalangium sp.]|uniref:hypothetical protein n=1 Tax=Hyalangium sp. TaxID=2028555 RepID=UPI003899C1E1
MSSAPDSSGQPSRSPLASVGRAAFFGLAVGMVVGGFWLAALGLRGLYVPFDCAGLTKNECELSSEAMIHVGRVQTLCGGALIALALSLYVVLRPYLFSKPAPPQQP